MKLKYTLFLMLVLTNGRNIQALEDFTDISLDDYLSEQRILVTEGYVTATQKAEFIQDMQRISKIKKILEIGFNAGHSAELFLSVLDKK